jgi:OmpA-OmpF porin, OOP family
MKPMTTALAAPLLMLAAQANSQEIDPPVGLYAGGALTQSNFDVDDFGIGGIDEKGSGWKLLLGYRFNRNFGVESSFIYFGQATVPANVVGVPYLAEVRAIPAFGVGFIPLGRVDLFGKIGMALIDAQGTVGTEEYDDRGIKPAFGLGAQLRLNRFAIRAEYEKFDTDVIGNVDLISLGISYTFGSN